MTLFAHVVDGAVVEWGSLPGSARRLDTGEVVYDLPGSGSRWMRATGWFPVAESAPPEVGAGEVPTFSVELVGDVPVQVWRPRPWTVRERTVRELRDALTELEVTDRPLPVLTRAVTAAGRLLLDEED